MKTRIKNFLFESKWLLVPFYVGLVIALGLYAAKYVQELWHVIGQFNTLNEMQFMLALLTLIDITLVANLIKMIITSSYQTSIERTADEGIAVEKVSSSYLKVKIGSTLIGVSSIHLLKVFIDADALTDRDVTIKIVIHVIFVVSTIGLAYINYLHEMSEK
jgi:uncharacterized protein (TIGR00645 family)